MTGEIGSALEDISMKVFNLNNTEERKATGVGGERYSGNCGKILKNLTYMQLES